MRPTTFDASALRRHLRHHKIADLLELKQVLGTDTPLTVFRKLKQLDYRASYTHRGRFYTLAEIARFDDRGLWSHEAVWFSRYGTLLSTVEAFVNRSPNGYYAAELANELHAEVQEPLRHLVQRQRLSRMEIDGQFLYTAIDLPQRRNQILTRRSAQAVPFAVHSEALRLSPDELKAAILLFYSLLDEQQRRLFAGLESIRVGHGGDTLLSDFLGLDVHTVARGRQQLLEHEVIRSRVRRTGGGRTPGGKKTPDLVDVLHGLLAHDTAGDPITGLRWSRRTTVTISAELVAFGISVSPNTVARLLHQMGYSLRVNHKQIATTVSPDRNLQFEYLAELRDHFQQRHLPIVSVDSKKRELLGNFKNPGRRWECAPRRVYDHNFRTDSIGVAIPYGIYDVHENRGTLVVGVSHDTPAFAAHAIAHWWRQEGSQRYFRSRQLLVLADTGGSNSCRCYAWKTEVQSQLANPFALTVTVAHYPTGASKWNPIEHRLFSEVSRNWAGEPLDSYQKILNYARTTRTQTGLKVTAYLDRRYYPCGLKPSPDQIASLRLHRHDTLPDWNYTIKPQL